MDLHFEPVIYPDLSEIVDLLSAPSTPTGPSRRPDRRPSIHRQTRSDPILERRRRERHIERTPTRRPPTMRGTTTPLQTRGHGGPNRTANPSTTPLYGLDPSRIHFDLLKTLRKPRSPNSSLGRVYIVRNPDQPGLVKIGHSIDLTNRFDGLRKKCNINLQRVMETEEITDYKFVEKMVKQDLKPWKSPPRCGCNTRHTEWFKVDGTRAIATVRRWERFMSLGPYTCEGRLTSLWEGLLRTRGRLTRTARTATVTLSDDERWQDWAQIISIPTYQELVAHHLLVLQNLPIWYIIFTWPQQMFVLWGCTVIFGTLRNIVSFSILGGCVAWFCIEVVQEHRETLLRKTNKAV